MFSKSCERWKTRDTPPTKKTSKTMEKITRKLKQITVGKTGHSPKSRVKRRWRNVPRVRHYQSFLYQRLLETRLGDYEIIFSVFIILVYFNIFTHFSQVHLQIILQNDTRNNLRNKKHNSGAKWSTEFIKGGVRHILSLGLSEILIALGVCCVFPCLPIRANSRARNFLGIYCKIILPAMLK